MGNSSWPPGVDVVEIRRRNGMVFGRANPLPRPMFDNVTHGPRLEARCETQLKEVV
jgi:phosphate transport system ATP-binding protein